MTSTPLVSVVMPVYNGERYLRESIKSILNQTYSDFEFVVVNDGSTDATASILNSYADPRLIILENKKNLGIVRSLNLGLQRSHGEYVARHDADDLASPHRLESQVRFLDARAEIVLVGSAYNEIDANGKLLRRVSMPTSEFEVRWRSFFQNPFVHSAVMYRRLAIIENGGYSEAPEAQHVEDYDLWRRLLWAGHNMASLPEPLTQWRVNPNGVSRTFAQMQQPNYERIVSNYLSMLISDRLEHSVVHWLCQLQTESGIKSAAHAKAALEILPSAVDCFARHYRLNSGEKDQLERLARRIAARTLLHNARQFLYGLQLDEARKMAQFAAGVDMRILFTLGYWVVRLKLLVGVHGLKRLSRTRARIRRLALRDD